jgi:hypothetical protein
LNKLIGLIVAFLASFFLLYALVSKDQPAKHAGLKSADLPPCSRSMISTPHRTL